MILVKNDRVAVSALIAEWIARRRTEGLSFDKIAREVGVSKPMIVQIANDERKLGTDVEQRFADHLFGGSVDALRAASRARAAEKAAAPKGPPNFRAALELLRAPREVPDAVVQRALRVAAADTGELDVDTWIVVSLNMLRTTP